MQDVAAQINSITQGAQADANSALESDDFAEAKRVLTGAIRDLRDLKRALSDEERSVRESYQDARLKTRQQGQTIGLFLGSKGRGAISRGRAIEGRALTARQAEAVRPYQHWKAEVDRAIAAVDRAKADVTNQAADAKEAARDGARSATSAPVAPGAVEAAPAAPIPPPPPPPAWLADPTGRHTHRYWDGSKWTEHVADNGIAAIDPL